MALTANAAVPPPANQAEVRQYAQAAVPPHYTVGTNSNLSKLAQNLHATDNAPQRVPGSDPIAHLMFGATQRITAPGSGEEISAAQKADVMALQRALNIAVPELRKELNIHTPQEKPLKEDGDYRMGGQTSKRLKEFLLLENEHRQKSGAHPLTHDDNGFDIRVVAALARYDIGLLPAQQGLHDSAKILLRVLSSEQVLHTGPSTLPGSRGAEATEVNRLLGLKGDAVTVATCDAARSLVEGKKFTTEYGANNDYTIDSGVAVKILQHAYHVPAATK